MGRAVYHAAKHGVARRFTVKQFLSHLHTVMYEHNFEEPAPLPYAIAHVHHVDYILVPNYTPLKRIKPVDMHNVHDYLSIQAVVERLQGQIVDLQAKLAAKDEPNRSAKKANLNS